MSTIVLQIVLYAFGPFFGNPFKPLIATAFGRTTYSVAYKHFWDQHKTSANLIWHLIALFFQLFSNFAFLASLDALLRPYTGTTTLLSSSTALGWIIYLLFPQPCPAVVKAHSAVWIIAAYSLCTSLTPDRIEILAYVAFFVVWLGFIAKRGMQHYKGAPLIITALAAKIITVNTLKDQYTGAWSKNTPVVLAVFFAGLLLASMLKDPVKGTVAYGAVVTPVVAMLIDSVELHLFSFAYVATALQGLAHSLSGEEGTLLVLQDDDDAAEKVSYEWAHVCFFPNLLGNAVYDTLVGTRRKARVAVVPPVVKNKNH